MPSRATSLFASLPPDGLAATEAGTFGRVMETNPVQATAAKLQRAKDRLYVLFQATGWGLFLTMQFVFSHVFASEEKAGGPPPDRLAEFAALLLVTTSGCLLTHYARPLITRWGWKQLGWKAVLPRMILMAVVLSLVWSAFGYGYIYGVLDQPWKAKFPLTLFFLVSWLNGTGMFLGWLCVYFMYHVFERINRLQVEQLQLAANVKEAELRALKSQVNPHFLFNSLNSLRALIDEDAPRAREAVTRLSNMLRYSLQSGQQETVPFEDEVRIVEDYLALEAIRHEDRLRVRWDITAEVRAVQVPPMLLQTLVENAVKYGISTRREGGELTIRARFEGSTLAISVTNPGDLNAPASHAAARAGSSTGVGLRNASERLQLLFGHRAHLTLRAEPVGHVTADVVIPLNHTAAP